MPPSNHSDESSGQSLDLNAQNLERLIRERRLEALQPIIIEESSTNPQSVFLGPRVVAYSPISWSSPVKKPRKVNQTTPEVSGEMDAAFHELAIAEEVERANLNLPSERRESEYIALIRSQQGTYYLSASEVTESETPIHIDRVEHHVIKTIATNGHRDFILGEEGKLTIVCSKCDFITPQFYAYMCLGFVFCSRHIPKVEECIRCHQVRTDCTLIRSIEDKQIWLCNRCETRMECRCGNRVPPELAEYDQCLNCYSASSQRGYPRTFSKNGNWLSAVKGRNLDSSRIFSCELETLLPGPRNVSALIVAIPHEVGATSDGSIHGPGVGVELQTPRLQGDRGEELIRRITAGLKASGAEVNDSCGFHIHLDGAGIIPTNRKEYPKALIQLWKTHLVFEDVILSFLPFKRRFNRYCRPMRDYFKLSELSLLTSMFEVEKLWYKQRSYGGIAADKGHHYHPTRYFGLNLHSLLAEKNLEIRYHTGTINAKKILHWVNLHSLIMDNATAISDGYLTEAQATSNLKEKTRMLFDIIGLNTKSQQYFFERQRKFTDKAIAEDETVESHPRFIIRDMLES